MQITRRLTTEYTLTEMRDWVYTPQNVKDFMLNAAHLVNDEYGHKYDWSFFNVERYLTHGRIVVCYRKDIPVGFMLMRVIRSVFDVNVRTLYQDLLFAEPGTRAAKYLMREFIDFGKLNADHIMTMIGFHTNIKASSLEKLGFGKLEELYSMET